VPLRWRTLDPGSGEIGPLLTDQRNPEHSCRMIVLSHESSQGPWEAHQAPARRFLLHEDLSIEIGIFHRSIPAMPAIYPRASPGDLSVGHRVCSSTRQVWSSRACARCRRSLSHCSNDTAAWSLSWRMVPRLTSECWHSNPEGLSCLKGRM